MAVFSLKLFIICYLGKVPSYTPSWCNNFVDGPIIPIVVGCLGIALWLRIAIILEPVIGKSKWVNLIADNTYSIMMNHFMGMMLIKTVYALISKMYVGFSDFDWIAYKYDIIYYYMPKGIEHTLIVYVVGGIAFSIMVQKTIDFVKKEMGKLIEKKKSPIRNAY